MSRIAEEQARWPESLMQQREAVFRNIRAELDKAERFGEHVEVRIEYPDRQYETFNARSDYEFTARAAPPQPKGGA